MTNGHPQIRWMVSRWREYGNSLRLATAPPLGAGIVTVVGLTYLGLFLWLSGMLVYNSHINHMAPTPKVYYDLNPQVMQPYLIFVPTPDSLLFVDLTGAIGALVLSGLVGLNAAMGVQLWRRHRTARQGAAGLVLPLLPTMVPNLGLGCCPTLPLLLGLLPSSTAAAGLLLGRYYGLTMGVGVLLMLAMSLFMLGRLGRANCRAF